jgi:hypothetical protein
VLKLALPIVLSAALAGLVTGSAPAPASAAKKKVPAPSPGKKSSGTKTKAAAKSPASKTRKTAARSGSSKKSAKKGPVRSWRTSQQQPAPERYREIQQALIGRGYLEGPATGVWGAESMEALKKFQLDQNLKGDGKLDSLSLIALGLGPKRTANQPSRAQP